jgi:hypothetical protein
MYFFDKGCETATKEIILLDNYFANLFFSLHDCRINVYNLFVIFVTGPVALL